MYLRKFYLTIFDFYMENYINPNIIYNIDNCYKLYFTDLYNELSKNYKVTTQDTLIFRKKYERVNYIIKLLKDKNIDTKDYKKEAIKILLTPDIKNYSMYIDNFYLNMNRKSKKCSNCAINIILNVLKKHNFKKIFSFDYHIHMKFLKFK